MATDFETVNTRKLALAAKYGYAPAEVAEDGIDEDGITVLVSAYLREKQPSQYASYQSDSPVVQVQWATYEQSTEAREARIGDYIESLERRGVKRDGDVLVSPTGQRVRMPDSLI